MSEALTLQRREFVVAKHWVGWMDNEIVCSALTECEVSRDGKTIHLGFIDGEGRETALQLQDADAQALILTLPTLVAIALRRRTLDVSARFVFCLSAWTLEQSSSDIELLTLSSDDGFKVTFALPPSTKRDLATTLSPDRSDAAALPDFGRCKTH